MSDPGKSLFKVAVVAFLLNLLVFDQIMSNVLPRNFRAAVVQVYGKAGHGSGSIVKSTDKKSYILTNRHVCEGIAYTQQELTTINAIIQKGESCLFDPYGQECMAVKDEYNAFMKSLNHIGREVSIKFNNLNHPDIKGKVLRLSTKADLCLVEVNEGNLPEIELAKDRAVPGDKILSIGNPKYMTNAQTSGFVGDDMTHEGRPYQHHTGIIMGGNSGGPVVSEDRGELVGINTLGTSDPTASYMIPLTEIKKFLEE